MLATKGRDTSSSRSPDESSAAAARRPHLRRAAPPDCVRAAPSPASRGAQTAFARRPGLRSRGALDRSRGSAGCARGPPTGRGSRRDCRVVVRRDTAMIRPARSGHLRSAPRDGTARRARAPTDHLRDVSCRRRIAIPTPTRCRSSHVQIQVFARSASATRMRRWRHPWPRCARR